MSYALLFKIANLSVLPGWFLLVFFPKHRVTQLVVQSYLYPIVLGTLYFVLLVTSFGGEGGMDSLEHLKLSFTRDEILVLGWVHYLVFDLFIGAWIVRDSTHNKLRHLAVIPCLLLTLFVGPVGLLSYLTVRWFRLRKLTL